MLTSPVGDERRVEALAAQDRALLAGLGARVVLGEDRQLVLGENDPPHRTFTTRRLRRPQRLSSHDIGLSLADPHRALPRRLRPHHTLQSVQHQSCLTDHGHKGTVVVRGDQVAQGRSPMTRRNSGHGSHDSGANDFENLMATGPTIGIPLASVTSSQRKVGLAIATPLIHESCRAKHAVSHDRLMQDVSQGGDPECVRLRRRRSGTRSLRTGRGSSGWPVGRQRCVFLGEQSRRASRGRVVRRDDRRCSPLMDTLSTGRGRSMLWSWRAQLHWAVDELQRGDSTVGVRASIALGVSDVLMIWRTFARLIDRRAQAVLAILTVCQASFIFSFLPGRIDHQALYVPVVVWLIVAASRHVLREGTGRVRQGLFVGLIASLSLWVAMETIWRSAQSSSSTDCVGRSTSRPALTTLRPFWPDSSSVHPERSRSKAERPRSALEHSTS